MKRFIMLAFVLVLTLSLCACRMGRNDETTAPTDNVTTAPTTMPTVPSTMPTVPSTSPTLDPEPTFTDPIATDDIGDGNGTGLPDGGMNRPVG